MQDGIDSFMPYLNELLEENTFISGNFVTIADINITILLKPLFEVHFESDDRKKYRNVTRWFNTMSNQKKK